MTMPILDKFLFCMELETGGLIIGWLGIISCIITTIYIAIIMLALLASDWAIVGLILIFPIIIIIGFVVMYAILITAVKQRNHNRIIPAMVAVVLGCLMFAGNSSKNGGRDMLDALLLIIVTIYEFLVLYSLYVKFRNEKEGFTNVQAVPANQVIIQQQQVPQMHPGQVYYIPQQQMMMMPQQSSPQQYAHQQQQPQMMSPQFMPYQVPGQMPPPQYSDLNSMLQQQQYDERKNEKV